MDKKRYFFDKYNTIRTMDAKKWVATVFVALAFSLWIGVIAIGIERGSQYADEKVHVRQINRFFKGNFDVLSGLTTIPGYHLTIFSISKVLGTHSVAQYRIISLMLSLISIGIFFLIAKKMGSRYPIEKTLQFIFLPIVFFYFPFVYTDIFSLLIVLVAFYLALAGHYKSSAFISLLSLAVRQNNIIWTVFIWAYIYVMKNGFHLTKKSIYAYLRETWGYILVMILFGVFVWLNQGIAIGDRDKHHLGFYTGNLYFFLASVGFLFLPVLIANLREMITTKFELKKEYVWVGLSIASVAALVVFTPMTHEYNLKMRFLRNIILHSLNHEYIYVYAAMIFLGWLALFKMKLGEKEALLFPFVALGLSQSFLIEQRYYIVPIVFLLLFRKEMNYRTELSLVVYFLALSIILLYLLLMRGHFF